MGDVLKFTRKKPADKARERIMCANNHHKWQVQKERKFDVKQGRLVTQYRCQRCGVYKTALH